MGSAIPSCPINFAVCFVLFLSFLLVWGGLVPIWSWVQPQTGRAVPACRLNKKQKGGRRFSTLQSVGIAVTVCISRSTPRSVIPIDLTDTLLNMAFAALLQWEALHSHGNRRWKLFSCGYKAVSFCSAAIKVSCIFWLRCESSWLVWGSASLFSSVHCHGKAITPLPSPLHPRAAHAMASSKGGVLYTWALMQLLELPLNCLPNDFSQKGSSETRS